MHMMDFNKGKAKPATRSAHAGQPKATTKGYGHGGDVVPGKGTNIDRAPKVIRDPESGVHAMGVKQAPGGAGKGYAAGGGGGSPSIRNFSNQHSAGGWDGPQSTLKAGMRSAISERKKGL